MKKTDFKMLKGILMIIVILMRCKFKKGIMQTVKLLFRNYKSQKRNLFTI